MITISINTFADLRVSQFVKAFWNLLCGVSMQELMVLLNVYANKFISRARTNGLIAWFESCEYAEYKEIDQNSEKNIFSLNEYLSEKEY